MSSFEEMFTRYFARVYKFALKLTRSTDLAEDITQQTFYKALSKIDSFQGRSDVGTWLCSIAKNEYFTRCRRREALAEPDDAALDSASGDVADRVQRGRNHSFGSNEYRRRHAHRAHEGVAVSRRGRPGIRPYRNAGRIRLVWVDDVGIWQGMPVDYARNAGTGTVEPRRYEP